MNAPTTKRCSRCGEIKELAAFYRRTARPIGVQSRCKVCMAELQRETAQRRKQRETTPRDDNPYQLKRCPHCGKSKAMIEFYQSKRNADGCSAHCKQCSIDFTMHWAARHKERHKATLNAWRKANKDRCREHNNKWSHNHRALAREKARKYHALKLQLDETFTAAMDEFVHTFWGNCCAICGREPAAGTKAFALDHWRPLSKGNALAMNNAVLMCQPCNSGKRDRDPATIYSPEVVATIERKLVEQALAWETLGSIADELVIDID
jgi:hypothetical protein